MLDEVERAVVRPVQVFEHQDQRVPVRDRLDEALPGREGLLAAARAPGLEPDEGAQAAGEPLPVTRIGEQLVDRRDHLRLDVGLRVGFEHPDMRAQRLAHGAERAATVGERASLPPGRALLLGVRVPEELPDEPALPHPRRTDERHELGRALVAGTLERVAQQSELDVAPDEARAAVLADVDAEPSAGADCEPDRHRLRLSLRDDRRCLVVDDRPVGRPMSRSPDEHAIDGCRRLHAGRSVHDVAGDEGLALGRSGVERDESLAGVDGDADVQPVLDHRVAHGERRPNGALRVVLVRDGSAEDGHHGIPDELLDRPAVVLELVARTCVIRGQRRAHVLWIRHLGASRLSYEVDEHDADDLPLLPRRRRRHGQGRATGGAEPRIGGALAPAAGTDDHQPEGNAVSSSGRACSRGSRERCRAGCSALRCA